MVKITIDTDDDRPRTIKKRCAFCRGSGRALNDQLKNCPVCRGRTFNVFYIPPNPHICRACGGSGQELGFSLQPDPACGGTGWRQ